MALIVPESLDIFALPWVPYAHRRRLPNAPAVYFVLRGDPEELLYIGQSKALQSRWIEHDKAHHFTEMDRIAWLIIEEGRDRIESEIAMIQHWKPRLNFKHTHYTDGQPLQQTTVRIDRDILRKARYYLDEAGLSINQYLVDQLEAYVWGRENPRQPSQTTEECA